MSFRINSISTLAFYMAVYDDDTDNKGNFLFWPTVPKTIDEYFIYGWNYKKQAWVQMDHAGGLSEAKRLTRELHITLCVEHGRNLCDPAKEEDEIC